MLNLTKTIYSPLAFIGFFLRKKKYKISILLLITVFLGVVPIIDSIILKNVIDTVEYMLKNNSKMSIFKWAVYYALWWEGVNWAWVAYNYFFLKTIPTIQAKIIEELYDYVQHHGYLFFKKNTIGEINTKIHEAAHALEDLFYYFIEHIFPHSITLIATIVALSYINLQLTIIFVLAIIIFLSLYIICEKKNRHYFSKFAYLRSVVSGKIVDALNNINIIRMTNNYKAEKLYLKKYTGEYAKSSEIMHLFLLKLRYFSSLVFNLMIFGVIYYIITLYNRDKATLGDLVLVITLCVEVVNNMSDFVQDIGELFEQIGNLDQSLSLLHGKILDSRNGKTFKVKDGHIEFKNVSFRYIHNNNLFENKSIIIEAKQKIGLAGFSGSGKSTFVNLICRLYEIESGQILIDGKDISKITLSSLRSEISFVIQNPTLFNRSLRENLKYGCACNISDEQMIEAAKKAYIHDVIMSLPDKYDTILEAQNSALSTGQKQRLMIARAILKNSPILILDEATNALDAITQRYLKDSLNILMKNKTVLVIAHRLSTLKNMDRILVFSQGSIVEDGTHSELLTKKGLYYKLWSIY